MEHRATIQTPETAAFTEKRNEHRRRVLKTGTFLFNKGYASYGCTIRNMNDTGAMVEMGETTGIPQQFEFRKDDETPVPAKIIWRTKNRIGIQFTN
ncbi:MAG: PilZ domain-containing protein [Pseudomonadota bacterium]